MDKRSPFLENIILNQEKIKISPIGKEVRGFDGRVFVIDGEEILKTMQQSKLKIPLDINHEDNQAVGWFDAFELREDGIYATLELNKEGLELIESKSYLYLSPSFNVEYDGEVRIVRSILSVGLVNRPNLLTQSLNKGESMKDESKKELQDLREENQRLQKELQELQALKENNSVLLKQAREEFVDLLIANGAMLPSRKEDALSLEGNAFRSFCEVAKSEAEIKLKKSDLKIEENSKKINPEIAKQLGLK